MAASPGQTEGKAGAQNGGRGVPQSLNSPEPLVCPRAAPLWPRSRRCCDLLLTPKVALSGASPPPPALCPVFCHFPKGGRVPRDNTPVAPTCPGRGPPFSGSPCAPTLGLRPLTTRGDWHGHQPEWGLPPLCPHQVSWGGPSPSKGPPGPGRPHLHPPRPLRPLLLVLLGGEAPSPATSRVPLVRIPPLSDRPWGSSNGGTGFSNFILSRSLTEACDSSE